MLNFSSISDTDQNNWLNNNKHTLADWIQFFCVANFFLTKNINQIWNFYSIYINVHNLVIHALVNDRNDRIYKTNIVR